jgi:hypothetical protein
MISKEKFIEYMDCIKKAQEKDDKINDFLDNLSPECGCGVFILYDAITSMIKMLCDLMEIKYDFDDYRCPNDIDYFIYELEWGTKWTIDCYTEEDGTPIDISTVEKLYDYIKKEVKKEKTNG